MMSEISVLGIDAANLLSITLRAFSELEISMSLSCYGHPQLLLHSVTKTTWMSQSIITFDLKAIFVSLKNTTYTAISLTVLCHLSLDLPHSMQCPFLLPLGLSPHSDFFIQLPKK